MPCLSNSQTIASLKSPPLDSTPFGCGQRSYPNRRAFANALYHARARWYQPRTNRFLSPDPLGVAAGVNPCVFAGNDPLTFADKYGLAPCRPDASPGYVTFVSRRQCLVLMVAPF
ncbi:MAG: RHS repeat domain-containing protein [Gemmatimonadaceae bacterium]